MKRRHMLFSAAVLLFFTGCLPGLGDHRQHLFEQGNQSFEQGDYAKAVSAYEDILEMGFESPALYYNLGNAFFKEGKIGPAILNYERALRLAPRDEDIRFNLRLAEEYRLDKIQDIPTFFTTKMLNAFLALFGLRTFYLLFGVFYIIAAGAAVGWIFSRSRKWKILFRTAGLAGLVLMIFFGSAAAFKTHNLHHGVEAVVLENEVAVRSAPTQDGTHIFAIHEGLKVKVLNRRRDWIEIKLDDGKEGWLPAGTIGII